MRKRSSGTSLMFITGSCSHSHTHTEPQTRHEHVSRTPLSKFQGLDSTALAHHMLISGHHVCACVAEAGVCMLIACSSHASNSHAHTCLRHTPCACCDEAKKSSKHTNGIEHDLQSSTPRTPASWDDLPLRAWMVCSAAPRRAALPRGCRASSQGAGRQQGAQTLLPCRGAGHMGGSPARLLRASAHHNTVFNFRG